MTSTAVSKVFADLDKQERMVRLALSSNPSADVLEAHRKIVESPTVDLLTSDAAEMLAGVAEHPAITSFVEGAKPLVDRAARAVGDHLDGQGVARVLREREELEAKLMKATGEALFPEMGHGNVGPINSFPGGAAEAALAHDVGHLPWPDAAGYPTALATTPPAPVVPISNYRPPIVVPKRRSVEPVEPTIVPADLAEVSAAEEARSNLVTVEGFLHDNDLDDEIEHLELVAVRLASGTKGEQVQAATSASLLFQGVADFVFPGQEEEFVDRFGSRRSVEKKDVRNRISAFIDKHLRSEISTHDSRRLQAKIDFAHNWSAKGHHVAYPPELANRAYRDLLEVFVYVARARERSLRSSQPT